MRQRDVHAHERTLLREKDECMGLNLEARAGILNLLTLTCGTHGSGQSIHRVELGRTWVRVESSVQTAEAACHRSGRIALLHAASNAFLHFAVDTCCLGFQAIYLLFPVDTWLARRKT